MRTGKSLLGLSVVGQEDGAQLGKVRDLLFDHDANELLALVVSEKDLFGLVDATVVLWDQIESFGSDVVLVKNTESKVPLKSVPRLSEIASRETTLAGTQILTTDGQNLGTLADTCLDEESGKILGFEISSGFVADTLRGKKFLPAPPGVSIGRDAAVAPPEAAEKMTRKA